VVHPEEGFNGPIVKKKKTKVGATVEPTLGILLRLEVGPEEGYDEPVGKSEMTTVGATV
jgi:hypothetical protein